jgi:hypothetical protein
MAKKKSKPGIGIAICLVAGMLWFLGHHMWYFDYNVKPPSDVSSLPILRTSVAVDEVPGHTGFTASFSITNAGQSRITVLDTVPFDYLFDVSLDAREPDGTLSPVTPNPRFLIRHDDEDKKVFDRGRDAIVDLLPGRTHTIHIPLATYYDLNRARGKFQLTVVYQPEMVAKMLPPEEAQTLGTVTGPFRCVIEFELPLKKEKPPALLPD